MEILAPAPSGFPVSPSPGQAGDAKPPLVSTDTRGAGAFDHSLEMRILREAADEYASRHGERGSSDYRAAWLRFRQTVRSIDDLERVRARSARLRARAGGRNAPADTRR